jgi:glycosyltransferase involved in cell wall biosynthesis
VGSTDAKGWVVSGTSRIKVVHVIPDLGVGGAERMLSNLAVGLDPAEHDVRVISLYAPCGSSVEMGLRDAGIETVFLDKRRGFDRTMFSKVARACRALEADVIHTHRAALQYLFPIVRPRRRPVVVHTVHTLAHVEVPRAARPVHRLAFWRGALPVTIGDAMSASFQQVYGRAPSDVIPNGVSTSAFASPSISRNVWRRREGLRNEDIVFASVARLSAPKDPLTLVRAFAVVADADNRVRLLVAGGGPLRSDVEGLAAALGVSGKVRILGARTDVADVLGASDAFILSSTWEGSPLSIMEAMAAGLPVICTAVGGVPEVVDAPRTGLLVPPNSVTQLADAIARLAGDAAAAQSMGDAGRQRARSCFDTSVMTQRYSRLYARALGGVR